MAVAKNLMILGTSSEVGKTSITLAIAHWLAGRGVQVAPFKSMLVGALLYDGPEGTVHLHQAQQAVAIGLVPSVDMNPVVLATEGGRLEIIVRGKASAEASALPVADRPAFLRPVILDSYQKLADAHEFVVIEGCGSPVELNLRDRDLVNLWVAEAVNAPCVLVADIEKVGVFASIVGVLTLLTETERARIIALIVNKFHGDPGDFEDGLGILRERAGVQRIGSVPFLPGLKYVGKEERLHFPSAEFHREMEEWTKHVESSLGTSFLEAVTSGGSQWS